MQTHRRRHRSPASPGSASKKTNGSSPSRARASPEAPGSAPTVEATFQALADAGHTAVVMQPVGFLCDHVEILYDIDIAFREAGKALGLDVTRAESLNESPTLIHALKTIAEGTYQPTIDEPALEIQPIHA